jgi:hypothetical protein
MALAAHPCLNANLKGTLLLTTAVPGRWCILLLLLLLLLLLQVLWLLLVVLVQPFFSERVNNCELT